jgi:O-antigen ligase
MEPIGTAGVAVPDKPNLTATRHLGHISCVLDSRLQWAALLLLIVGVSLEQPAFVLAGLTVKPEHLVLLILWVLVGWQLLASGRLRRARLLFWTVPLLGTLLVASLLNAPDPAASLRHTVMVSLVTSTAWLAFGLARTRSRLARAVDLLIAVACAEAVLTFLVLSFAWSWVPPGAQIGVGGIAVPAGTLWEPNFLGSYLAAGAVLTLANLMSTTSRRRAIVLATALALILTALGLSLARGAWLGLVVGVLVLITGYVVLRTRPSATEAIPGSGIATRRNVIFAVAATASAVLFLVTLAPVVFPGTTSVLLSRANVSAYDPQADPSLRARVDSLQEALPGIQAHPFLGNGAGSFEVMHQDARGNPGWLSNLEVHVTYDSGLIGLACWLTGLGGLVWSAGRSLFRKSQSRAFQWTTLGLLGALASLLVAFQVTEGSWLAFPWVYVGLLASVAGMATPDVAMSRE